MSASLCTAGKVSDTAEDILIVDVSSSQVTTPAIDAEKSLAGVTSVSDSTITGVDGHVSIFVLI